MIVIRQTKNSNSTADLLISITSYVVISKQWRRSPEARGPSPPPPIKIPGDRVAFRPLKFFSFFMGSSMLRMCLHPPTQVLHVVGIQPQPLGLTDRCDWVYVNLPLGQISRFSPPPKKKLGLTNWLANIQIIAQSWQHEKQLLLELVAWWAHPTFLIQSPTFVQLLHFQLAVASFLRSTVSSAKRVLAIVIMSVCPSVRPSVTSRYRTKPRWDRDSGFSPYDSYRVSSFLWANLVPLGEQIPIERGHQREVPPDKSLFYR